MWSQLHYPWCRITALLQSKTCIHILIIKSNPNQDQTQVILSYIHLDGWKTSVTSWSLLKGTESKGPAHCKLIFRDLEVNEETHPFSLLIKSEFKRRCVCRFDCASVGDSFANLPSIYYPHSFLFTVVGERQATPWTPTNIQSKFCPSTNNAKAIQGPTHVLKLVK